MSGFPNLQLCFLLHSETQDGSTKHGCDHHLIRRGSEKQLDWPNCLVPAGLLGHLCSSLRCVKKKTPLCATRISRLSDLTPAGSLPRLPQELWPPRPLGTQSAGSSLSVSLPVTSTQHREGLAHSKPQRPYLPTPHVTEEETEGWHWRVTGSPPVAWTPSAPWGSFSHWGHSMEFGSEHSPELIDLGQAQNPRQGLFFMVSVS